MIGFLLSGGKIIGLLSNFGGFFLKNWKPITILLMIGLLFYQNFMTTEWLKWVGIRTLPGVHAEYQEEIKLTEEQLKECEGSRTELKGQIDSTNEQINKWADISENLRKQHEQVSKELLELKAKSDKEVTDILAGPTPQTCSGAIKLLRESAMEK